MLIRTVLTPLVSKTPYKTSRLRLTFIKYLECTVAIRIDAFPFAVLDLVYLHKEPTWQDDLIVASAF